MKHLGLDTNPTLRHLTAAFLLLLTVALRAQNLSGGELLSLDPEAVTGHSYGVVTAIAEGPSDGSLWMGTQGDGILRIGRNGNRIRYTVQSGHLLSDNVARMCFVSSNILYILYNNGAISRYSSTEGFIHLKEAGIPASFILPGKTGELVYASGDGKLFAIADKSGSSLVANIGEPVMAMAFSPEGTLFLAGAESQTVFTIENGSKKSITGAIGEVPTCLAVMGDGSIWAGTRQGLYRWVQDSWKCYSVFDGLISNRINAMLPDGIESLMIVTSKGVQQVDVSNPNVSNPEAFYPGESFACGVKSNRQDNTFYFAGEHGVAVVNDGTTPSPFEVFKPSPVSADQHSGRFNIWTIFIALAIGAIAFFALRKDKSHVLPDKIDRTEKETDVIVNKAHKDADNDISASTDSHDIVSAEPPSHDEVFAAMSRLSKGDAPEFSQKVWKMIEDSYTDQEFSVADIADRLLLSRVHLNRKLQQEIGVSPSSLLKARRMTAARELMLKGGLSIMQIASMTGFSSAAFLSTSFKEYFGQTPSEVIHMS